MWTRVELKNRAKDIMRICYWKVFLVCLLASLVGAAGSGAISGKVNINADTGVTYQFQLGTLKYNFPLFHWGVMISIFMLGVILLAAAAYLLLKVFVCNVLRVGFCRYLILTQRNRDAALASELLWGFSCGQYMNLVKTMFLYDLYIALWSLLFVIPGIIKRYEYYCVPYILAEDPGLDSGLVFATSKEMTDNQKGDIFVLNLSFIGWEILGSLLFGIGTYFVLPYVSLTDAELYDVLRRPVNPRTDGYDSYNRETMYY